MMAPPGSMTASHESIGREDVTLIRSGRKLGMVEAQALLRVCVC